MSQQRLHTHPLISAYGQRAAARGVRGAGSGPALRALRGALSHPLRPFLQDHSRHKEIPQPHAVVGVCKHSYDTCAPRNIPVCVKVGPGAGKPQNQKMVSLLPVTTSSYANYG